MGNLPPIVNQKSDYTTRLSQNVQSAKILRRSEWGKDNYIESYNVKIYTDGSEIWQ